MIGVLYLNFDQVFIILVLAGVAFFVVNILSIIKLLKNLKEKKPKATTKKFTGSKILAFAKKFPKAIRNLLKPFKTVFKFFGIILNFLWGFRILFFNVALIAFVFFLYNDLFVKAPGVNFHKPEMNEYWNDQKQAFVIQFDRAYDEAKIIPQIYPEIAGEWKQESVLFSFFKRKLVFYPKESILPRNNITIYIGEIKGWYQTEPTWDKVIDLKSPEVPEIISSYPEKEGKDFGVTEAIELRLSSVDGDFVDWGFELEPAAEFQVVRNHSDKIFIEFLKPLSQTTTYTLKIKKTPQAIETATGNVLIQEDAIDEPDLVFTTIKAPTISNIEPVGDNVLIDSVIKVTFDFEMEKSEVEDAIKFEPAFDYTVEWIDGKTIIIKPFNPLEKETDYSFTIPAGLKNLKGGILEKDILHSFKTIGKVQVESTSPVAGSTARRIDTNINITFNQEVDKGSAQAKFSISPSVSGVTSWDGHTMIFNPSANLAYNTKYTVTIGAGVKTIHGIDGDAAYTFSFTSESQIFELNTLIITQPYRYSCNLTASRIALNYKGVNVSVDTLYSQVAKDNTPWNSATNTWGNPHSGFVGDITGAAKGYGVYWGPVRNLISNYRPAENITGTSRTNALNEVRNGNPVIIWAHNAYAGSGANISWNLSGGGSVYAVKGMHSFVIRGYVGSYDNPTSIILADPSGRGRWVISTAYFDSLWSVFGRAAVVVR